MTFGKEFTRAVEQKQIAQQDAERSRFIVEKAEQERQANVIRAEGEAESADIISKAVAKAGDGLLMIRRIEASKEIAQTLASNPNVTYLPGGGEGKDGGKGAGLLIGLRPWDWGRKFRKEEDVKQVWETLYKAHGARPVTKKNVGWMYNSLACALSFIFILLKKNPLSASEDGFLRF